VIIGSKPKNVDNLNNVRRETSRHFRNKKKEYLKAKIDEIESNSKIKILGTCIGASMTLRRVTSLELI
jgi:poly(3-hydroxyalkanoate) synthetase